MTVVPELAQIGLRHYSIPSYSFDNQASIRKKRFLLDSAPANDGPMKISFVDQMVANAFKDVNFTRVAMLMLQNNETMSKLKQNIDTDVIIKNLLKNIDYDKLGNSIWVGLEEEFDVEHFLETIINITHIDIIHHEFVMNKTIPDWLIASFHPDLSPKRVNEMFSNFKVEVYRWVDILTRPDDFDDYLYQMVQDKFLVPLEYVIQRVQNEKPKYLEDLLELILNSINKFNVQTPKTTTSSTKTTASTKKSVTKKTTASPISATNKTTTSDVVPDDVRLLLYQISVVLDSFGQLSRDFLKAIQRLYCSSVWE